MDKQIALFIFISISISCGIQNSRSYSGNYNFDPNPDLSKIEISANEGNTIENAIIIKNAKNTNEGVAAEYAYVTQLYGSRGLDWNLVYQEGLTVENRTYDKLVIRIESSGEEKSIFFDITSFYGKFLH